jgi:hypothetical protein
MLTASEATQAIVELQEQDDGTTSDDGEPLFTVHGMMEKIYAGSLTRAEANRVDLRVVDAYLAGAYGDTEAAGYSADVRNVLSQLRDSEE